MVEEAVELDVVVDAEVVEVEGANEESNISHSVVTTTGDGGSGGCCEDADAFGILAFLILSTSSVSTYFCTLLT